MKTKQSFLIYLFGILVSISIFSSTGCNIINPEEEIPSFIHLNDFQLVNNPNVEAGSLNHFITHGRVFVNDQLIGFYPIPSTIPVFAEGESKVRVDPVIRENGTIFELEVYPFFEEYITTIELDRTEVDTIQPITRYIDDTKVELIEDFEVGEPFFSDDQDGNPETSMELTETDVFEGNRSGVVRLNIDNPSVEIWTDPGSPFDLNESPIIYLELNYKTDTELLFGLVGKDPFASAIPNYEFGLFPQETWNKVYFNLSTLVRVSDFEEYRLGLLSALPIENGVFTIEEAEIHLDNIKLIKF